MDTYNDLKEFYKKLVRYQNRQRRRLKGDFSEAQDRSLNALRLELQREHGRLRDSISKYGGEAVLPILGREYEVFSLALSSLNMHRNEFTALDGAISLVNRAIGKLEAEGESWEVEETRTTKTKKEPLKAFIAHEGMTRALQKVKDFLDALGVKYLIAEIEPSDGRVVEEQVEWTKGQAGFAIILATRGKIINKETGKPQMGLNVADELGRAREVFKNRIILLLQTGVEPHANVSGIVYESFTTQYMENVFKKIVKEIRNWGFI